MNLTRTRERTLLGRSAPHNANPLPTQCTNSGSFHKDRFQWRRFVALVFLVSSPLLSQSNRGELHITVTAPSGRGIRASVKIVSNANGYRNSLETSNQGILVVQRLPFGIYELEVDQPGFAHRAQSVEIRSSLPTDCKVLLNLPTVNQSVTVSSINTLIDPDQPGSVSQIGTDFIQHRLSSVPGREVQDLVNSQPGWLYEGNAVLHPRGSEYQTQFVIDGIPLTDNRSPSFGPEIEADDIESLSVFTAGIPAEYGRKMGGVVEVNTLKDPAEGFHGQVVLSGGSFDSAAAFARAQYSADKYTLGASASGSRTDHYLNPVVPQNFSNTGTLGDFAINFDRDCTPNDRVGLIVRHAISRYDIPNEQVQQAAGQRQTAENVETMGIASYEHIFSENAVADLRGMVRSNANDFSSNTASDPIEVFQHNWFHEGYVKASATIDRGHNEWKAGVESDNLALNENLSFAITDASQFDPGSPLTFAFQGNHPDYEQSAFVQDLIRLRNWTINAGLRWDHYQLLLNQKAFQPRLAISHYFPSSAMVVHFSYDRVFQTPSFENILLSSSAIAASIDPQGFLRLPIQPSRGDYYEAGLTRVFFKHLKLGSNYFRRVVDNYADDSQIDNTTISFPIAFRKAILYGAEGQVEVPDWHHFSGYGTYSYIVGNVWLPVTGGLFFGANASAAASQLTGHTPGSQDQRNTVRGRIRYQISRHLWIAWGAQFDSGLPFQFDGDPSTVLAEYGQQVLNRLNFARGRILPAFQVNASGGADIYSSERMNLRLQADGQNLNNILNVIDFGGLFSGNAIGPSRSILLRLTATF
jgi:TonB-dependent Receptor Plug Domain